MTLEAITDAMTNFGTLFTNAMGVITGNVALMAIFVGGSVIPVAFRVFKRAKKAVR